MPHHNLLSKKVTLTEDVTKGQIVSYTGAIATTGTAGKAPAGVAQYDGKSGEIIAITVMGFEDVPATGLAVGQTLKVTAGAVVATAATTDPVFATVTEVNNTASVEIVIK